MNVYEQQASFVGHAGYLGVLALQHIPSQQRPCSPSMFVDAIRLFPPSYQALAACGKHERFDHEGFSACFPRAICFVSRRDRFSPALLLWVSQAVFSCAGYSTCTIRS